MDNILLKHQLLSYFRELINSNKLEEEHDRFFDMGTHGLAGCSLQAYKNEGYIEVFDEVDFDPNLYATKPYYFKEKLSELLNTERNRFWESFIFYLNELNSDKEISFFINQQLSEILALTNETYQKENLVEHFEAIRKTLTALEIQIQFLKIDNTSSSKIKWNKHPHFFFLLISSLINEKFIIKSNSQTNEMIYMQLFNTFKVNKKNSKEEYTREAFVQNCKTENDLFNPNRLGLKLTKFRELITDFEANLKVK